MSRDAIFLHSSWRAASTYVWAKFRERTDSYCYFEPLNEHLFTATAEVIDRFVPWSFANHPPLKAPYLAEYRPLIRGVGGIPGFPAHLTFGRYCAGGDDSLPELEAYMDVLAALAGRMRRRPVYGFVRTDMRIGWFRSRMAGAHVFIRRDPRRQFLSMLRQAVQGNPYFLLRGVVILRHNMEAAAFAPLLAALERPALSESWSSSLLCSSISSSTSALREAFRGKAVDEALLRQLYFIFYFMRLVARRIGERQCQMVIDIDRLSLDGTYRRDVEGRLADMTGVDISFADCLVERYERNLDWSAGKFEALEREVELVADAEGETSSERLFQSASATAMNV